MHVKSRTLRKQSLRHSASLLRLDSSCEKLIAISVCHRPPVKQLCKVMQGTEAFFRGWSPVHAMLLCGGLRVCVRTCFCPHKLNETI